MSPYKEIHIWQFPATKTFVKLKRSYRERFFAEIKNKIGIQKSLDTMNGNSTLYGINRRYNRSHFGSWRVGIKKERYKTSIINTPLWVLIEFSKMLSGSNNPDNDVMRIIEHNIESYTETGKAIAITKPRLPLLMTPEMVSVIFHLCGDGHIGTGTGLSNYRQTNKEGLNNFINKLHNIFGSFDVKIYEDSKVIIPRTITDFYMHFFKLNNCGWNVARIPDNLKRLPKEFLVAGLAAFIVDEGSIRNSIDIYSSNIELLRDVEEILSKLNYISLGIKEKYRYGKLDSYRLRMSLDSAEGFHKDIERLIIKFPSCCLAHKQKYLDFIVKRKLYGKNKRGLNGHTREKMHKIIGRKPSTTWELSTALNICHSSTLEHLQNLEKAGRIKRFGKSGKHAILWKCV